MADKSPIEWTDATWSPLRVRVKQDAAEIAKAKGYTSLVQIASKMAGHVGPHCEKVSDGCKFCYSETNCARCLPSNGTGLPFDRRSRDLVEPFVDDKALMLPLHWKKPRKIFVENQSDLFGEWWPDEMIAEVIAVGLLCPHHTLQILTKRAARMRSFMAKTHPPNSKSDFWPIAEALWRINERDPKLARKGGIDPLRIAHDLIQGEWQKHWPPKNVWLGVSCEDQQRADERIPDLLATPAAVRFISAEPLLGPVDLAKFMWPSCWHWDAKYRSPEEAIAAGAYAEKKPQALLSVEAASRLLGRRNGWVIVGGESGPGARPCDVEWIRSIVHQCAEAAVACFVKQLGRHVTGPEQSVPEWVEKLNRKGGNWEVWPEDLRVREMPKAKEAVCRA